MVARGNLGRKKLRGAELSVNSEIGLSLDLDSTERLRIGLTAPAADIRFLTRFDIRESKYENETIYRTCISHDLTCAIPLQVHGNERSGARPGKSAEKGR